MRLLEFEAQQFFPEHTPKRLDPFRQRDSRRRERYEQMHVIWHQEVSTDSDILLFGLMAKSLKALVNFLARQQFQTSRGVESDKIKWSNG